MADSPQLSRLARAGALSAVMILVLGADGWAQSVRGRVLDAVTGDPIGDATVELRNQVGARLAVAVTDGEGLFRLPARGAGQHHLQARHLSYGTITTEPFDLQAGEQILVDLRLAPSPLELAPLRITGRRPDPRHQPTLEGLYARAATSPSVGPARVFAGDSLRQLNEPLVKEILRWEIPSSHRRSCTVVYWNGYLVGSAMAAQWWLDTSAAHLEGVEFYADQVSAPMAFREIPEYLADSVTCSVVVLWPRR